MTVSQLDRFIRESAEIQEQIANLDRRNSDLVAPRFEGTFRILEFEGGHREKNLENLALLSWYLREDLGLMIRLWIEDQLPKVNMQSRCRTKVLISNAATARMFFSETHSFRKIKGNFLDYWRKLLRAVRTKYRSNKNPKRKVRRRGYDDHGTLRPAWRWSERSCATLTEKMNEIEAERASCDDTAAFLEGWFS
jgi:hypothetical protein